jgi:hypothetical protein
MALSRTQTTTVVCNDALSPFVVFLSKDAGDAELASTVGLNEERTVVSRRCEYGFFTDSLLEIFDSLATGFCLRLDRDIAPFPRESG